LAKTETNSRNSHNETHAVRKAISALTTKHPVTKANHMKQETVINMEAQEPSASAAGNGMRRRSFMKGLTMAGAGLFPAGAAFADRGGHDRMMRISESDADILRFLAAAEILETDLWQQYTEFANQEGPYREALEVIDDEMPSYIVHASSSARTCRSVPSSVPRRHGLPGPWPPLSS
jgi:hypothetical protein